MKRAKVPCPTRSRTSKQALKYPLQPFYMGLGVLRGISDAKKARKWLSLSNSQMAQEVTQRTEKKVTAVHIAHWESGRRGMPPFVRDVYAVLIANRISAELRRIVGITIYSNSPWRVMAWSQCSHCGNWFNLRDRRIFRCHLCSRHHG